MTKTERFSEESSHCYTYDSLVREMASAMEVNSEMIYPVKEGQFDYEDIESWIGAVSFKEGKAPNIQASLSSDRGLRVVKFDVADQKAIESLDEKATKEQLIFTMALTMAKMKVISDIAEETYPAVAFQIADYRKEMEKVLNEILSDKRENTSLENLIKKVTSRKGLVAVLVIGGMILAACGVIADKVTPDSPSTSTPNQPPVTEVVPDITLTPGGVIDLTQNPPVIIETATETVAVSEEILASVPGDLSFIDGRKVVEMISGAEIDAATGLEVALDGDGGIVAYNLGTEGKDMWVVNPLIEQGFKWNFDKNESGQNIMHHALEEWKYEALPIEGIKFIMPDQLPATFWDESNPAKAEEAHPWPSDGTLAVLDGNGDLLMYYSKQEGAWWYAGYQEELPGNMTFRQTSMSLALSGIRYKQVEEDVWPGPDLDETWQEVRNHVDWLAYTNRTGNFISFENFSSRVKNGEVFSYQSWVFDLASGEYKLTTIDNKTKFYFETSIVDRELGNSYDGLFDGNFHGVGLEYSSGIQLNPDGSISIIRWVFDDAVNRLKPRGMVYFHIGTDPFLTYTIDFLAAGDKYQKEGVSAGPEAQEFWDISPVEIVNAQVYRLIAIHNSGTVPEGVEYILGQYTPIIIPYVKNPHPYQKP